MRTSRDGFTFTQVGGRLALVEESEQSAPRVSDEREGPHVELRDDALEIAYVRLPRDVAFALADRSAIVRHRADRRRASRGAPRPLATARRSICGRK